MPNNLPTPEQKQSAFLNTIRGVAEAAKKFPLAVAGGTVDIANIVAGGFANVADAARGKTIERGVGEGLVPKPVGGTEWLYEKFGMDSKSSGIAEDAAAGALSPLTPGGFAKALIIPAATIIPSSTIKAAKGYLAKNPALAERVFESHRVYFSPHDNVARTLISDKYATIKPNAYAPDPATGNIVTSAKSVRDLMDHPQAFDSKELSGMRLAEIEVQYDPSYGLNEAGYSKTLDTIFLGPASDTDTLRKVVLHELQHAVQGRNKMGGGSNPALHSPTYGTDTTKVRDYNALHYKYKADLDAAGLSPQDVTAVLVGVRPPPPGVNPPLPDFFQIQKDAQAAHARRVKAIEDYRAVYGEAEARAVEKLADSEIVFPHLAFDVPVANTTKK